MGSVCGPERSGSPWRGKKEITKCSYRRVEKKAAPEQRFFIKKETLILEGTERTRSSLCDFCNHLALSLGMWKPWVALSQGMWKPWGNLRFLPPFPPPPGVVPGWVVGELRLLHPHLRPISRDFKNVSIDTTSRNDRSLFENKHFRIISRILADCRKKDRNNKSLQ